MGKGQRAPATVVCTPVTVHNIAGSFVPNQLSSSGQGGQQIGVKDPPRRACTQQEVIPKLFIRAVSKSKKDTKAFILWNVSEENVSSILELKYVIKEQLKNDINDGNF